MRKEIIENKAHQCVVRKHTKLVLKQKIIESKFTECKEGSGLQQRKQIRLRGQLLTT